MIEFFIITLLVLWSCVVVFKKLMPNTANRAFMNLANFCQTQGWQKLAKWLQPKTNGGCAGGCGCDVANTPTQASSEVNTIKWK
ncbi:MAG: hypothetical protein E6Q25_01280 [Acinetobacter sp.]|nr:MAG: hypothetical protein E6Q25_01280 [Acinetobacter sp.]